MKKHLKHGLIILFSTFVLAEVSIRLAGYLSQRGEKKTLSSSEGFRLVFLGNSHTWGAGVERSQAYGQVLADFFKAQAPRAKIVVVESGILNGTTKGLNRRMDELLPTVKPNLVVVMGGEPNIWNRDGFPEYLATVQGKVSGNDFPLRVRLFLSHSRFIKWLFSLSEIPIAANLSRELQDELAVYRFLADFDVSPGTDVIDAQGTVVREALKKYVRDHEKNPPPEWRRAAFALGLIELRRSKNYAEGFRLLESAIARGPDGAYELQEIIEELEEKDFPAEQRPKLSALKKNTRPGELSDRLEESANAHKLDTDPKLVEYVVKNFPYNSRLMFAVAQNLAASGNQLAEMQIYDQLLRANPLQNQFASLYDQIERASRDSAVPEARVLAKEIMERFGERFPTETLRFNPEAQTDIEGWISWDLGNLVRKIRRSGSEVVLQTYHYYGHRPHLKTDVLLHSAIAKAAKAENTYFLETHGPFQKEIAASPEDHGRFFVDNWLHPSVTGHRIIARIIYDYLNERRLLPPELLNLNSKLIYTFSWE